MSGFLYVLTRTLSLAIGLIQTTMFLRVILSFFGPSDGRGFRGFLEVFTEFFVAPVRAVMEKFEFVRRSPLDLSFFITYLLFSFLSIFLV